MTGVKADRGWLERELEEVRTREAQYRDRLARRDAEVAHLDEYAHALHRILRERPPSRETLKTTLRDVAALSGKALSVSRTSIWHLDAEVLTCSVLFEDGRSHEPVDVAIRAASCPAYMKALSDAHALVVEDVYDDARTQELVSYLRQHKVGALLDIPIVIAGELLGVVCHEHVGEPRTWSPGEVGFASSVGYQVALALESERRIRAEYAARGTEARYQHLVESLPVTVYSFDARSGKIDYVSPAATGLDPRSPKAWVEDGVGPWLSRIHPDDRGPIRKRFERGVSGGFPEEATYRITAHDGSIRWIRDTCRVVRDHAGDPIAIQGVLSEVTEQATAQLAREEAERRYHTLLEHTDVVAVALDLQGRVSFANQAFLRVSGYAPEQLLGLDWFNVVLPPAARDAVRKRFLDDMARGTVAPRFEIGIVTKHGAQRQLLTTNTILRGPDGALEGTLSLALDVTDRRSLEQALLQQTKLESLGRLAAGVAHDFNNLLTVMLMQVDVLKGLVATPAAGAPNPMLPLEQAIGQATDLARSLLLYGRKETARSEVFVLDALVQEAQPLLEALAGRELQLVLSLHADGAKIASERARVRQVLLNLVGNAVDATRGCGTTIRIATHMELVEERVAREQGALRGGEFVVLTVADDGPGMNAGTRARIFDPFFTTKADGRGTGLGLAITQSVATQAGGFIRVESEPGAGTTFRVSLPIHRSRSASSGAPASRPASDRRSAPGALRVLVVEDMHEIRATITRWLSKAGYDVIAVATHRAATEVLGSAPVDVLLTDLHLPDGSGAVLARSARLAKPTLRVVLMSGSGTHVESFDGLLNKPFLEADLLSAVTKASNTE